MVPGRRSDNSARLDERLQRWAVLSLHQELHPLDPKGSVQETEESDEITDNLIENKLTPG